MKLKRLIALLLTLSLCVGALPLWASAAVEVSVKRMSSDFISGYYVVYEYKGAELRSDALGPNTNYDLWCKLNPEDKRDVLNNFAFGPSWMEQQFGPENAKLMASWWNDASGWSAAKKLLEERIAKRDFPELTSYFTGNWEDKVRVDLPEVKHKPSSAYAFLPEVQKYLDLESELRETWSLGQQAYKVITKTKMDQTAAAVTSLSGDLISLICERALVPAITPGGLSALAPSFKGEVLGALDKLTGFSDTIIEKTVGKRLDAKSAREVIDTCWQIIETNDMFARQCVSHFLSLKGQKSSVYSAAAAAIDKYIAENGEVTEAAVKAAEKSSKPGGSAASAPSDPEKLYEAGEKLWQDYRNWQERVSSRQQELSERLWEILGGAMRYDDWPDGWGAGYTNNMDDLSDIDFGQFYNYNWADHYYDTDLGRNTQRLPTLVHEMPAAFNGAKAEAESDIAALTAYIPEAQAAYEKVKGEWPALYARFLGIKAAYARQDPPQEFMIPTEDVAYIFADFYQSTCCGGFIYDEATGEYICFELDQTLEEMNSYLTRLGELEQSWNTNIPIVLADLQQRYNTYLEKQTRWETLVAETEAAGQRCTELLNAFEKKYGNWNNYTDELAAKLQEAENDEAAFESMCRDIGREVDSIWREYEPLHLQWLNGIYELDWLEEGMIAALGANTFFGSHYGDHIDLLNAMCGGQLRYPDELMTERMKRAGALFMEGGDEKDVANHDDSVPLFNFDTSVLRHAQAEFNKASDVEAQLALYFDHIDSYKGTYLRADAERRESLAYRLNYGTDMTFIQRDGAQYSYQYGYYRARTGDDSFHNEVRRRLGLWDSQSDGYKPVTGLSGGTRLMADGYDLTLVPGETYALGRQITVSPADATDKSLIWESSDYSVCWVDENGVLTGNNPGEATITVRAADSEIVYSYGEYSYNPEPLTFTVRVGAGSAATGQNDDGLVPLQTFGDGALYDLVDNGDGTVTVSVGVGMLEENQGVAAALYSGEGRLLGLRWLPAADGFVTQPAAFTAPGGDGLVLKLFALDAGGGFAPLGEPLLEEAIK